MINKNNRKNINVRVREGELRHAVEGLANTLSNKISQKQVTLTLTATKDHL